VSHSRDLSAAGSRRVWRAGSREIVLDHPIVMGILNVTPDSFSDGGNFFSADSALEHAERMIADGADIVDIGGESTRPGAKPVREDEERRRVRPLVRTLREAWPEIPISIDTTKASVAEEALAAGADIINDVSALRLDAAMAPLAGRSGCGLVLMHSRGSVEEMATYQHAEYHDVVKEVLEELNSQLLLAEEAGVERKAVVMDPGFGFSKKSTHSITLLRELERFSALDTPIMVGMSRKRFVRETISPRTSSLDAPAIPALEDRDGATAAVNVVALQRGAMLFRVHNVRVNRIALDSAWTILNTPV
jgi:dihydropteroate synthase